MGSKPDDEVVLKIIQYHLMFALGLMTGLVMGAWLTVQVASWVWDWLWVWVYG